MTYVLAFDVGTTGLKTCLFGIGKTITMLADAHQSYGLYIQENGGAEQDADEWWLAMCAAARSVFQSAMISPSDIAGISFCSQMQGLVLVDKNGVPVRRPMSYMDQRAKEEIKRGMAHGLKIAGANAFKLLKSLYITGAVSNSVKDPVWKYKWVERNEPEVFSRVHKWLDVKEYLIHRCTDAFVMTEDSAYATLLCDIRGGKRRWSAAMCKMLGVNMSHLPKIIPSQARAGGLTSRAAEELGLLAGTPVFGGGGDASLIGVGSGCVRTGDTHIYCGTSGWVSTVTDRQTVDANAMIAAIVGVQERKYNYFAEMETAGKCLEWVKDHLALDEIGIYLTKKHVAESGEAKYASLYDYLTETIRTVPPGSGGVLFTPWLHGNRCPFEDPHAAGMFFNIRLETGKTELISAVLEGVCFHLCWMLECQNKKVRTSDPIRFVGGGALSDVTAQILSNIIGRKIEVVANPQNVGSVGAAAIAGVGLGVISNIEQVRDFVPVVSTFFPQEEKRQAYQRQYHVFKQLYRTNRRNFAALNRLQ